MSIEDFLASYIPTDDPRPTSPSGAPKVHRCHAEIRQVLLNIGNQLKDQRPDDGRPLRTSTPS
jgi:hypothetical protein